MIIKDMLYLIHVKGPAEHASPNARSQQKLAFVYLEKTVAKSLPSQIIPFLCFVSCMVNASCSPLLKIVLVHLLSNTEENDEVMELVSIQDLFSAKFPVDTSVNLLVV
jgi:hypothetical protein